MLIIPAHADASGSEMSHMLVWHYKANSSCALYVKNYCVYPLKTKKQCQLRTFAYRHHHILENFSQVRFWYLKLFQQTPFSNNCEQDDTVCCPPPKYIAEIF